MHVVHWINQTRIMPTLGVASNCAADIQRLAWQFWGCPDTQLRSDHPNQTKQWHKLNSNLEDWNHGTLQQTGHQLVVVTRLPGYTGSFVSPKTCKMSPPFCTGRVRTSLLILFTSSYLVNPCQPMLGAWVWLLGNV